MKGLVKFPKTGSSTNAVLLAVAVTTFIYGLIAAIFLSQIGSQLSGPRFPVDTLSSNSSNSSNFLSELRSLQSNFDTWLRHLIQTSPGGIRTQRTACRELEIGAQTCVFEGIICANVSSTPSDFNPVYYLVDDTKPDGEIVAHDSWCRLRHVSGDPRTFGNRQWPRLNNTFVPQLSCLNATYRTTSSLFGYDRNGLSNSQSFSSNIRWFSSLHSVLLTYQNNDHNYHLLVDIYWLLDLALFQKSLDIRPRPGHPESHLPSDEDLTLFHQPQHYYMGQSKEDFIRQTRRDENRLAYAIIMQKDPRKLYSNFSDDELHAPSDIERPSAPLLDAFPELVSQNEMLFHGDMFANQSDLVCTARLTVGAKIQDTGHERVCRHIREKSYELYGLQRPPIKRVGRLNFPQPPKSILVLNRHASRKIGNPNELLRGLRTAFEPLGVEIKYITTQNLRTAEQLVRVFSSAGVIIAPHGGQNIGALWMQRFRYVVRSKLFLFLNVFNDAIHIARDSLTLTDNDMSYHLCRLYCTVS